MNLFSLLFCTDQELLKRHKELGGTLREIYSKTKSLEQRWNFRDHLQADRLVREHAEMRRHERDAVELERGMIFFILALRGNRQKLAKA